MRVSGITKFMRLKRRMTSLGRDARGASAVEFALVLPLLGLILFAIIKFGLLLHNRVVLADAVRVTARELAIGRGSATPWTNAKSRYTSATGGLINPPPPTMTVNSVACTADATCATTLGTSLGKAASVSATYPCDLTIMGVNFFKNCSLAAQMTERVE